MDACAECSQSVPGGELLSYGDIRICSACKETFLDKLKQGVRVGKGPWRDRKTIVFTTGTKMPKRCLRCNDPGEHALEKSLSNLSPWLLLLILFGLPGIIAYLIIGLSLRRRENETIHLCGIMPEENIY